MQFTEKNGELTIHFPDGGSMVFDSFTSNEGVSFVRFYDSEGEEGVGWVSQEWAEDPEGVIGAMLGKLVEQLKGA